jgi:hypothetical protein
MSGVEAVGDEAVGLADRVIDWTAMHETYGPASTWPEQIRREMLHTALAAALPALTAEVERLRAELDCTCEAYGPEQHLAPCPRADFVKVLDAFKREHRWRMEVTADRAAARAEVESARAVLDEYDRSVEPRALYTTERTLYERLRAILPADPAAATEGEQA